MTGLMLFDFDGTLYRGDAPFRYYAEVIARFMKEGDRHHYLGQVESHLDGTPGVVAGDNWEAVVQLAEPYLPDSELWQKAFLETREYMLDEACPLEVAPELRAFLRAVQGKITLACACNSPPEAAIPLLQRRNLYDDFDHVLASAGKPPGLITVAERLWDGPVIARRTISVGDNYKNDIAPAFEAGWDTAHISPHGYFPGPSTMHGYTIEEVIPFLRDWVIHVERNEIDGGH